MFNLEMGDCVKRFASSIKLGFQPKARPCFLIEAKGGGKKEESC